MPYIPQDDRKRYDRLIEELATLLRSQDEARRKGHANYLVTQVLRKSWNLDESQSESYSSYADVISTLECAKLELYRAWVGPYEEGAIKKHGNL